MLAGTITKWGNSQGVRLPKSLLNELNWTVNDEILLSLREGKLVLEKSTLTHKSIQELFKGYAEEYVPYEIDWGEPKGKEIW